MAAKKPIRPNQKPGVDPQTIAQALAEEQALELVELTFAKEPRGMVLCAYLDKEGGITLDDCERFHRAFQPKIEDVAYDFLEVSSPGLDRPVKNPRDVAKNLGNLVEVRLFSKQDGAKSFRGTLKAMDDDAVTIASEQGDRVFPRASVALVKPIIEFDESEFEQ